MSDIPEILINTVVIPKLDNYYFSTVQSLPQSPPVTLQIGNPIIELPGCVKFNDLNKESKNLIDEDERGNVVLCDAGSPTYEAIDYQPEELIYVEDAVVPNVRTAPEKKQEEELQRSLGRKALWEKVLIESGKFIAVGLFVVCMILVIIYLKESGTRGLY